MAFQKPKRQPSDIQHAAIGDILVTVINDGIHQVSFDDLVTDDRAACEAAHTRSFRQAPPWLTINCFLICHRDRIALIDSGFNDLTPYVGRLSANLEMLGIAPSDIDTILMTHMHPDHESGLINGDGNAVFSNAELVLHQDELAFWRDDCALARASEEGRGDFLLARKALAAYEDRIRTVRSEDAFPGIRSIPTPGHTPGHTAWHIESEGESLLVWGDIIHFPGIQFAIPEACVAFDLDAAAAANSRKEMLSMVAAERMRVAGIHHDFPAFGRVVPSGSGYRFLHEIWNPFVGEA